MKKIIFLYTALITVPLCSAEKFLTNLQSLFTYKNPPPLQACKDGQDIAALNTGIHHASNTALHEKDSKNNTILHYICRYQNYAQLIPLCIQKGLPLNARNNAHQTALHIACLFKNHKAVELLLAAHALINVQDSDGDTPLFYALDHEDQEIIQLCIQHKAHLETYNNSGLNPLFVALTKGSFSLTHMLLVAGCSLKSTYQQLLPLEYVLIHYPQNKKLFTLLLTHEATISPCYPKSDARISKRSYSAVHLKHIITLDTNNIIITQHDHAFWRLLATIKNSKTIQTLIAHAHLLKKHELIRRLQTYMQS